MRDDTEKPTIVLLHGFVASKKYWQRVIPILERAGYDTVYPDLAGFGDARRTELNEYTYGVMCKYIDAKLQEIPIRKPFIIVGHSMGALIAAYYAKSRTSQVERLVMLNPPLYLNTQQALATLHATGKIYRFLLSGQGRGLLWGLLKLLPGQIGSHSRIAREQVLQNIILNEENFSMISTPVVDSLLVVGRYDRPIYSQNLKLLKPSRKLRSIVVETNHHGPRTDPELIARLIGGLDKLS